MSSELRQFWTGFIEIYKENECLWWVKSADYSNRAKKNRAFDQLVKYSKAQNSAADVAWVKKKIANFRTVFVKEHKKMEESQRSGAGADEVYRPTLWYYDLFKFTLDQEPKTPSQDSLDPHTPVGEHEESWDVDPTLEVEDVQSSDSAEVVPVEDVAAPRAPPAKQKRQAEKTTYALAATSSSSASQQFFQHAEEVLKQNRPLDDDQIFANYLATEMRKMPEDQKREYKRLLLEATLRAMAGSLSKECQILPAAGSHLPTVPPPTLPPTYPMHYASGNPPYHMPYYPPGPTQPSPSPQSSTSSSGMFFDPPPPQDNPRFFNL